LIIISQKKQQEESSKEKKQTPSQEKTKNVEIEELRQEVAEKTDLLQRLQAEFANYKRRTEEERAKIYPRAVGDVLKKFIGIFDDFELALKASSNPEEFRKGVELIFAKLVSTAEEFGLKKIDVKGKHFDPQLHEALLTEETDDKEQVILEELQSGYQLNDVVLRTAKVKVSKPKTNN
jgi:molecular chaperone GrpE